MSTDAEGWRRALGPMVDLVAPTPAADQDEVVARVERVVAVAAAVLGVDTVGLTLLDESDRPRVAAASDERAAVVELAQLACAEGPGIDATATGNAVRMYDLQHGGAYPSLARRLAAVPVRALLSAPVLVDHAVVGSLTATMRTPHCWTDAQLRAATAYADVVALALRVNAHAGSAGRHRVQLQQQVDLAPSTEEAT